MAPLSRPKQGFAWIVAAFLATAGLVTVLVWEHRPASTRHALYIVGIPEKGAALFFGAKHCSICHAVNGTGGHVAPDLSATHPGKPAMAWLTTVLWNHAPGMWRQMRGVKSPDLSQEEMAHMLAFLYQAGTADRPGDKAAGERVFSDKGCSRCHSIRSAGGHSAPDLSQVAAAGDATVWLRAMWNHAQSMIDPITKELGAWPQFHNGEMNDLLAYVSAAESVPSGPGGVLRGSAEKGWQVFQGKCIQCHSVRGNGGKGGPELGPDHELPHTTVQFAAVLWNHAPAMVGQARQSAVPSPTLQGEEIADLLQFIVSLQYFEPTGSPFLCERVFPERGCARGHGSKAEGTAEGPHLRAGADAFTTVSLATSLWRHGHAMRAHAEELGIAWPVPQPPDIDRK